MSAILRHPANVVYATAGIYAVLIAATADRGAAALAQSGRALCAS